MPRVPVPVERFLSVKRIAVAGVSRASSAPANAIFRRLRETGHEPIPLNPNATDLEGEKCYPSIEMVPSPIEALMVVTHPAASESVVRSALALGITQIWFHRSFGDGSVSEQAIAACRAAGVEPIVGGCPLMYCGAIDPAHRVFRWWLTLTHRGPV